jgi:hypothetical protein
MDIPNYHLLCGGNKFKNGEIGGAIDFGWRPSPPELLKATVPDADGKPRALFTPVMAEEDVPSVEGDRVFLWEWVRAVVKGLGSELTKVLGIFAGLPAMNWQFTGSCVNGGMYNALVYRAFCELAMLPQAESPMLPFTLMAYGRSRYDAFGDASEGDGSLGDAMAAAMAKYGAPPFNAPGLPPAVFCGPATCYDRATEFRFSSVRNHSDAIMSAAKPYTITYGIVRDPDEAEAELRRLRPLTWAGDWGGQNRGVVNSDGLLMMPRRETWNHQESVLGFIRIGGKRYWRIQNQWFAGGSDMEIAYSRGYIDRIIRPGVALPMHGENPDAGFAGPAGGYYVTDADMAYQCRTGEVRSVKSFFGYPGLLDMGRV